jgi:acyl carrier protein
MTADDDPRSPQEVERQVLAMWRETLGLDEVTLDDNFIDLGGDSISATLCMNRIQAAFSVEFPIDVLLLEAVSVRELAERIGVALGSPTAP